MKIKVIIITMLFLSIFGYIAFRAISPISLKNAAKETEIILSSDLFKWDYSSAVHLFYSESKIYLNKSIYERVFLKNKTILGKLIKYDKPIGEARFKVEHNFFRPTLIHYNANLYFEYDTTEIYMILMKENNEWKIYALNLGLDKLDENNHSNEKTDEDIANEMFGNNPIYPVELKIPYVQEGACPFECCEYGLWEVLKKDTVYSLPDSTSPSVGLIQPGEKLQAETGNVYVIPGIAKIIGKPYGIAKDLDSNKNVLILDYIGEGFSRIYQDGNFYETKIARTKDECKEKSNSRYCWVEILMEPISTWWVKVRINKDLMGWVIMSRESLKPIDNCS